MFSPSGRNKNRDTSLIHKLKCLFTYFNKITNKGKFQIDYLRHIKLHYRILVTTHAVDVVQLARLPYPNSLSLLMH